MTNRRTFLKLLGIAPIAPAAINLESALASIPEPTVEKIVNYIESPKNLSTDVIQLSNVRSVGVSPQSRKIYFDDEYLEIKAGISRVLIHADYEPKLHTFEESATGDVSISFDNHGYRIIVTGLLTELSVFGGGHPPRMAISIDPSEDVVCRELVA